MTETTTTTQARFHVELAIAYAKSHGKKVLKKDLASLLWPDSAPSSQQVNMTKLCSGHTASIRIEWVQRICEATGCSADLLFGTSQTL